jgi:hypothetical protein
MLLIVMKYDGRENWLNASRFASIISSSNGEGKIKVLMYHSIITYKIQCIRRYYMPTELVVEGDPTLS